MSFRLASEVGASMAPAMMAPMHAQIDPEVAGSESRDLNVAHHCGCRLASRSDDASGSAVHHLVCNHPSHDFIIDMNEARESFDNVGFPSGSLHQLARMFSRHALEEASPGAILAINPVVQGGSHDERTQGADEESGSEAPLAASGERDRESDQKPARRRAGRAAKQPSAASQGQLEGRGGTALARLLDGQKADP